MNTKKLAIKAMLLPIRRKPLQGQESEKYQSSSEFACGRSGKARQLPNLRVSVHRSTL